jgi:hypothetical protein
MYSTRDQATPFTVTFDFVMRQVMQIHSLLFAANDNSSSYIRIVFV